MLSAVQYETTRLADELKGLEYVATVDGDFAELLHHLVADLDPIRDTLPRDVQIWIDLYHKYATSITEEPFDKTN